MGAIKLYRFHFKIHPPSEETEGKYLAEVPVLAGCRAWGDTPSQALEYIESVAAAFIESYHVHGHPLPPEVEKNAREIPSEAVIEVESEFIVAT